MEVFEFYWDMKLSKSVKGCSINRHITYNVCLLLTHQTRLFFKFLINNLITVTRNI